jgi:hypothetical protein
MYLIHHNGVVATIVGKHQVILTPLEENFLLTAAVALTTLRVRLWSSKSITGSLETSQENRLLQSLV